MSYTDPTKRHEFVLLFDVTNGNPNGDPDAGNLPRVDPETMHGLVTDVALKRKVRDYLQLTQNVSIFIQSKVALNTLKEQVAGKVEPPISKEEKEGKKVIPRLQSQLCKEYFDIRMFGAVLATGEKDARLNAGQVRGPAQFTFARSINPVLPLDLAITRQARTTEERMETGTTEMGRKTLIPYGLYRSHGYFNPFLAKNTGVDTDDLMALWSALANLFDFDRSAARAEMAVRGLWVYTHDNEKGNAPAHRLFELIKTPAIERSPRSFEDYAEVIRFPKDGPLDDQGFPGVALKRLV
ncbi:MAG: type I-C CRISPR-associated protein Cas7/Csd2 [Syntrophobacterales bacterium]|jgi:CRISPR-associated protein Csd2|nr:type I-C CRISPR-associated protein Cas7/Csd2 [Syntrophobacterales bacterium]